MKLLYLPKKLDTLELPANFEGTLKENILYGNNINIEEHEIYKLINQFNLYPDETDIDLTKLVSNTTLSSGQMQKISFIRALLNNSEILLLMKLLQI